MAFIYPDLSVKLHILSSLRFLSKALRICFGI
jgi:hypothetical protein